MNALNQQFKFYPIDFILIESNHSFIILISSKGCNSIRKLRLEVTGKIEKLSLLFWNVNVCCRTNDNLSTQYYSMKIFTNKESRRMAIGYQIVIDLHLNCVYVHSNVFISIIFQGYVLFSLPSGTIIFQWTILRYSKQKIWILANTSIVYAPCKFVMRPWRVSSLFFPPSISYAHRNRTKKCVYLLLERKYIMSMYACARTTLAIVILCAIFCWAYLSAHNYLLFGFWIESYYGP